MQLNPEDFAITAETQILIGGQLSDLRGDPMAEPGTLTYPTPEQVTVEAIKTDGEIITATLRASANPIITYAPVVSILSKAELYRRMTLAEPSIMPMPTMPEPSRTGRAIVNIVTPYATVMSDIVTRCVLDEIGPSTIKITVAVSNWTEHQHGDVAKLADEIRAFLKSRGLSPAVQVQEPSALRHRTITCTWEQRLQYFQDDEMRAVTIKNYHQHVTFVIIDRTAAPEECPDEGLHLSEIFRGLTGRKILIDFLFADVTSGLNYTARSDGLKIIITGAFDPMTQLEEIVKREEALFKSLPDSAPMIITIWFDRGFPSFSENSFCLRVAATLMRREIAGPRQLQIHGMPGGAI